MKNRQIIRKCLLLAGLLFLALGLSSCVYYNTYYNAKRYYREGVKENENNETEKPKTTNYQKAIDSAARVLEYYRESKYIDDALLLMGKAYYEINSYPKAKKKFEELLVLYPDSPLKDEANLWLGKTLIAMGQSDQGIEILTSLWGADVSREVRLESQRRLADYHYQKENYRQALAEYQKIIETSEDKRQKADLWYQIGECHYALNEFSQAEQAYLQVLKEKPARKRQFEAIFKRSLTLRQQGQLEPALAICEDLLKKEMYFPYIEQAYLAKAEILSDLGRVQEAEELFKRIIELYPRTDTSAKASYLLGKIYLEQLQDLAKAEEYLAKVQTEKPQSEFAAEAKARVDDLRFLKSLNTSLDSLSADVDTLNYRLNWIREHPGEAISPAATDSTPTASMLDSLTSGSLSAMPVPPDSLLRPEYRARQELDKLPGRQPPHMPGLEGERQPPGVPAPGAGSPPRRSRSAPLPTDSLAIFDRMADDQEEMAQVRFRLAEHLWLQFSNEDSARIIFSELSLKPEYPDVAAKALLSLYSLEKSLSPDSTGPDSLLHLVHQNFPGTTYDAWVRPLLELELLPASVDTAQMQFLRAEDLWTSMDMPREAVQEYYRVSQDYPQEDLGAKALYAAAWLNEHILKDIPQALADYDSLIARFPNSPYVSIAQNKISPPPPEEPDTTAAPVDTSLVSGEVALGSPSPEGTGQPELAGGESALEDYIHKNHLYPQVAMEAGISGDVLVSFTVDDRGSARGFKVESEEPPGFDFGAMAIQALQAMKFRPAYQNGKYIESPAAQIVKFTP